LEDAQCQGPPGACAPSLSGRTKGWWMAHFRQFRNLLGSIMTKTTESADLCPLLSTEDFDWGFRTENSDNFAIIGGGASALLVTATLYPSMTCAKRATH
jgi:hypothetical protein